MSTKERRYSIKNLYFSSFHFVELRSQLIHKEKLLIEAKQDLEAMNEYQVFIFKIKFFFFNQSNSIDRKLNNNKMMK